MRIPDDRIDDFIDRYEKAFAERLSHEEARSLAGRLLELYRLILKRLPGDKSTRPSSDPQQTGAGES